MFKRLARAYGWTLLLGFLLAMAYALRTPAEYTTDALIMPKEQSNNSQASSGLATATRLLGLTMGGDQNSSFAKFQKYWGSRDVAARILGKYPDLKMRLFRGNWDAARHQWYDRAHTFRQYIAVPLNWLFGVYPNYVPTSQDVADYIKNAIKVESSLTTNEVHLTFNSSDPAFAQWFLRVAISETDNAVRDAERRRDQDFVDFARKRLEHEANVSYRDALTDSVRQFEISNIYSEAGDNFCFQYIEAPDLPNTHSSPRPLLYAILAFIFANILASIVTAAIWIWPDSAFARHADNVFGGVMTGWLRIGTGKVARRSA